MVNVILVLTLTNIGFARTYMNNPDNADPGFGDALFKIDISIITITVLVIEFLLVFIGTYVDRNTKAVKLGSAKKSSLAVCYIPCLVFMVALMFLQTT